MPTRFLLSSLVLIAAAASAGGQRTKPSEAAKAFTLDGLSPSVTPSPDATPAPEASVAATPAAAPTLGAPAVPANDTVAAPAGSAPVRAVFTLDTPIQALIADPGAKGVLDKDLPGMSDDKNLDKFQALSLRQMQPQSGGQLTDALLMKVASDLDKLAGGTGQVTMPPPLAKPGSARRSRDDSR